MFVGRAAALALGDSLVSDVVHGRGHVLLVAGEAGIGKTSLVRELLRRAEVAGEVPHWGGSFDGASLLPYGVWIDCLRHPSESPCATAAARLEQGDAGATEGTDAPAARRQRLRLFGDVVADLRTASDSRPQVLVLEDLHWADVGSLELLCAVAGAVPAMPVLVIATYRDDELPPGGPIARLGGGAERLTLEGLAEDEVADLLAAAFERAPSADETREVYRQTAGNPLFVTQIARLAHDRPGDITTVPAVLRDVLARRLARVSAWCYEVLGTAAILGSQFDLDTLVAVLGAPADEIVTGLNEAATARLVVPSEDREHWRFVHELIRSARYDALATHQRRDGHRRVTEVLSGRGASAGVLAHHATLGGFDSDDLRPAGFALDAAHQALRRMAWAEAATLARRSVRSAPSTPAGDKIAAEAWLTLGDALLRTGNDADIADAFTTAAELGRKSSPDVVARAALGFGAGLAGFEVRLLDDRQIQLLEEATAVVEEDSPFRPLLQARLSVALSFIGSDARRLQLADEAITLARQHGDDRAVVAGLAARCDALAGPDHVDERLAAATEILVLAQRSSDSTLELLGRRLRVVALLEQRNLPAFTAETRAYARTAARLGDAFYGWYVDLWRAMEAYADGRLDDAQRLAEHAAAAGSASGSHNAPLLCATLLFFVHLDAGGASRAADQWGQVLAQDPVLAVFNTTALSALVEIAGGRPHQARMLLDHFGPEGLDRFAKDQEWLTNVAQVVLAATRLGYRAIARRAYELLAPYEGLGVFEGIAALDHGVADRFLALAAGCVGDGDAALRHTERALLGVAGSGRLVVAHTRADGARALLATGDPRLHERGVELGDQAVDDYSALGLAHLADELRALVRGPVTPATPRTPATADHDLVRADLVRADLVRAGLVREGDTWAFTFDRTTVRVRHAKGVADLGVLLSQRGRPVHVRALEGMDGTPAPASGDVVIDDEAVRQYRKRLHDLEEALDEAEQLADRGWSERLTAERDALVDELTKAFGLGGRRRRGPGDPDERLRKAVSARIRASIDRLEKLHPALGRHLRHSIRTGYWCTYQPEQEVEWTVVVHGQR